MGTEQWMAPEVRSGRGSHPMSDVYGIGFIIYFIMTRRFPYELNQDFLKRHNPDKANSGFGQWLYEVMLGCMKHETEDRYSFKEIKKVVQFWLFKVYCENNDKRANEMVDRWDFDTNYADHEFKRTSLYFAAQYGRTELIRCLLDKKDSKIAINHKNDGGFSALDRAI